MMNISCSKDIKQKSVINETELNEQVLEAYKEGLKSLNDGDVLFAAKKFNEVEILYPLSIWAPKSSLMAAYAYYSQDYYEDAISELERLKKVYPKYKHMDYVHYLLAISHYEQIVDEKKDLQSLVKAKQNFNFLIKELCVKPKGILSLQKHFHRSEHWVVTQGTPKITLNKKNFLSKANDTVYIPQGSIHRIQNPYKRSVKIMEAQLGSILKETDIVRYEDVYGRVK